MATANCVYLLNLLLFPVFFHRHYGAITPGAISTMSLTLDSDLNEASPQITLACISTGGPATTVTC